MSLEIRKMIEFECSHQLALAESTLCMDTIHGHSYKVELFFVRTSLMEEDHMVTDFGSQAIKEVKEGLMNYYDHALLIPKTNPNYRQEQWDQYKKVLGQYNIRLRIIEKNPTAEMMAEQIFRFVKNTLEKHDRGEILVTKVRVHETRTGYAEFSA